MLENISFVCGGRATREPNRLFSAKWTGNYSFGASAKKIYKYPLAILKHADYNMNISGIKNHI
ncbi:hypothetical protein, partial [Hominenteromicrobium sp.]|uniref:hypothetical protein n=1 Tax=Hominenteromicrobium sp. TaxID=3073581 RepID=UPI003A8C99B0